AYHFILYFFFYSYGDLRDLHSFPTRRSSDLANMRWSPPVECPVNPKPLIAPLVLALSMALAAPAHAACDCTPAGAEVAAESEADRLFTRIHEEEWAWRQAQYGRGEEGDSGDR